MTPLRSGRAVTLLLTDSDVFAGTERHVLDLAQGLMHQGFAAAVGCPASTPLAQRAGAAGIEHRAVRKRGAIDLAVVRQLAGWLKEGSIDLIHAHNGRMALHAALARRRARRGKVALTQHFISPSRVHRRGVKQRVSRRVHAWLTGQIDHTIAISTAVRDAAVARGDAPLDRITVVHNGMADPAAEPRRPAADVRAELGVPAEAPLVVCAARLQPEKDVATLIEAMGRALKQRPDCRCVVAGRGAEREALAGRIESLGLGRHVQLLGFREDVRSIIAAGDLFVLPARAEPFGLVLLEAMALSRAVLATKAGGPLDIVQPGRTGELIEPMNAQAMAKAIVELLADKAKRRAMGQAGRQRFESHFTVDRMAAATADAYRQVLGADVSVAAPAGVSTAAALER